jgi:chorismate mutase/prephenate dehydratase
MKVAFQGERGAYSEEAIIKHWGKKAEPVPNVYLRDVFDMVEKGEADFGLVPVENTIHGSIHRTFDLLYERCLLIQGETALRIRHCLIAHPETKLADIKRVYSHPQALGQSREYLEKKGYEALSTYDTAGSVKIIKEQGLLDAAAIASSRAAKVYKMKILAEGIETNKENFTRFLIIGNDETSPTDRDKTTLAFIVEHKPGSLVKALQALSSNGINLLKIESRPLVGRPWEYIFYLEFEGHKLAPIVKKALEELREVTRSVKLLGSYPRA